MSPEWFEYGFVGLFLGAFLAATLIPFPSEALVVGALGLGFDPALVIGVATFGNFLGGMTNYGIGYLANNQKILTKLRVNLDKVDRWEVRSNRWGYWLGFLAWMPIIGDPMLLALGFLKSRFWPLCATVFIGKFIRYCIIAYLFHLSKDANFSLN
jgi:membrane protein YqaA with SNARE-associated domain